MVALCAPVVVGVKTTEIAQESPALSDALQLLVSVKLFVSAPVSAMEMSVRSTLLEFVRVAVCTDDDAPTDSEPKASEAGERLAEGTGGAVANIVKGKAPLPKGPCPGLATVT